MTEKELAKLYKAICLLAPKPTREAKVSEATTLLSEVYWRIKSDPSRIMPDDRQAR